MKLTYTEQFQLEGRGIKASGSANLQVEVDETTHGPLVDVLKAVVQALTAPVQTDGDKDDDEWGDWQKTWGKVELNDNTHIYGPDGQLLNVVPRPSREDDGDTIHVVVYGNFPKNWVVAYSDAGMQGFGPLDPDDAECWLEIFAPKGRKISVTFVDDVPEGCNSAITQIEVRDAVKNPLFVTLYPFNSVEDDWVMDTSELFFPPGESENLFQGFLDREARLMDQFGPQRVETPPAEAQAPDHT